VLELMIMHMASFTFEDDLFFSVKTHLRQSYYNEMIKPYEFAK
jgi:hypothetical protein